MYSNRYEIQYIYTIISRKNERKTNKNTIEFELTVELQIDK